MNSKLSIFLFFSLSSIFFINGCISDDQPTPLGKNMFSPCAGIATIAKSKVDCNCNIVFKDYVNEYTFTGIQSAYFKFGPVCKQNMFFIKFFNSVHDHNEPNYEFGFYLPQFSNEEFFKIDTFQIDSIHYGESSPSGGHSKPIFDADVVFIWDEVKLVDSIYSGKGKFIINKEIPVNYPATYFFPKQEIPFEFCE